ncbi:MULTISPECIES: hypothetical protein [unclassified Methanosarcina]|uniref:hypothetical protein n=1 Tax=unclassified Methanosarcina TaxID=2644672 RepID=UPI00064EBAED|nr:MULTISPECIES: hypothetical protein [unclassified Methanosarcina]
MILSFICQIEKLRGKTEREKERKTRGEIRKNNEFLSGKKEEFIRLAGSGIDFYSLPVYTTVYTISFL